MGIVDKNYLFIPDPSRFPDGGVGDSMCVYITACTAVCKVCELYICMVGVGHCTVAIAGENGHTVI